MAQECHSAAQIGLPEIFALGSRLLASPPEAPALRIAIAGSSTTALIARAIAVACMQEGTPGLVMQSPYAAWRQETLDPSSSLHAGQPDVVVLAVDWSGYAMDIPVDADSAVVEAWVQGKCDAMRSSWNAILHGGKARVIHHLPAWPVQRLTGVAEQRLPASPVNVAAALRRALLKAGPDVMFLDTQPLGWDAAPWYSGKLPFPQDSLPNYVWMFRALLREIAGRPKKVLAVDLDNTIWGGVIGDDGVDHLLLGPETPEGCAFADFQAYLRSLAARGIVLAVCSKNDPVIAELGFSHPHTALRRHDFAMFACGWGDKAAGLRSIAATLNVGLDSIVFADDNPAECALVRQALPQVAVVELGTEPADFVALLDAGHWFDRQFHSKEDFSRSQTYQSRAKAQTALENSSDLADFLGGLEMRGLVFSPQESGLARVAQMESKTNQFNMTTRRYGLSDLNRFVADPNWLVRAATLRDRLGDHGLVGSVVARLAGKDLIIENWLMSCRVFSRTLEHFMMLSLLQEARARNLSRVVGRYEATASNAVVSGLYPSLGFVQLEPGREWARATGHPTDDIRTFVVAH